MIVLDEDSIKIVANPLISGVVKVSKNYDIKYDYTNEGEKKWGVVQVKLFKTNSDEETSLKILNAVKQDLGI